jgi:coproporphyrinogen III oxidase-like Fe-S oxidoreductase
MNITINAEMVPEIMDKKLLGQALEAGMQNLEVGVQSIHKKALKIMQRPRNARTLKSLIETAAQIRLQG